MPFQASGGAISRLPPNKAAPQAPPRAGAGRAALAETQHGLEAAHTNSRSPRPLATSQASAPKPKPVDTIGHHAPQARVTGQGRHVGWRPSCLPGGSTTPSLCLPTPLLYPGKTKQVSAQGNPGWKWGTGAGMGPTAPDLKASQRTSQERGRRGGTCPWLGCPAPKPGHRVLGRSPPNAHPAMVGPCQGTGAPQSPAGDTAVPPSSWQGPRHLPAHTRRHPPLFVFHLFPPPTLAVEAAWRRPAGPRARGCCLAPPRGSDTLFRPQQAQPQELVRAAHCSETKIAAIIRSTTAERLASAQPQTAGPAAPPVSPLEGGPGGRPPTALAASPADGCKLRVPR